MPKILSEETKHMKWMNKGHELEGLGESLYIHDWKKIYIYGAGEVGEDVYGKIRFLDIPIEFADSNIQKQRDGFKGIPVISPKKIFHEGAVIVVAASRYNTETIIKNITCSSCGEYREGVNVFSASSFLSLPLYMYSSYVEKKLYFQDITILVTEKCTLKCRDCAPCYPYLKNARHRFFDEVKSDIDAFFAKVDYVWDLILTGGEPFLNKDFGKILQYVKEQYPSKYHHIQIISNATLVPSDSTCEILQDTARGYISISDYTKENIWMKERLRRFTEKMDAYDIHYEIPQVESWCDFGFRDKNHPMKSKEELIDKFDNCRCTCRAFHEGRFVFCLHSFYASRALYDGQPEDKDNCFISGSKSEMMEWNLGYSEKGYLDMCAKCNGYITINQHKIAPGIQMH